MIHYYNGWYSTRKWLPQLRGEVVVGMKQLAPKTNLVSASVVKAIKRVPNPRQVVRRPVPITTCDTADPDGVRIKYPYPMLRLRNYPPNDIWIRLSVLTNPEGAS